MSNPYPSESVTENLISQILAVGGTVPPSYGLGELNRALELALSNFHGSIPGASWPNANGSGSGNLQAATGSSDTVGYHLVDSGSGGIHLQTTNTSTGAMVMLAGTSSAGTTIKDGGATGVVVQSTAAGAEVSVLASGANASVIIAANGTTGSVALSAAGLMSFSAAQIGFFGAAGATQQSGGAITTVAQLVAALRLYGLLS